MSPTASAIVFLALAGVALAGLSMWRNPVLRRISLRNVARRKGGTVLVIVGSMVGTALIAGSLVINDTSRRLSLDMAYAHLGEIDEIVMVPASGSNRATYFDRGQAEALFDAQRLNELTRESHGKDLVDGTLAAINEKVPVQKIDPATGKPVLVEPRAMLLALDWDRLPKFGKGPPVLPRPGGGQVLVSERLAREVEIEDGDTLQIFAENRPHTFAVHKVVPDEGISGFGDPIEAAGTLLMGLEDAQGLFAEGADHVNIILVSNAGGIEDGFRHSDAVRGAIGKLDQEANGLGPFQVRDLKTEVMAQSEWMGQVFMGISTFGIVAGIMLVLNIYAMLAEERRSEMGVMRAMGARRGHLARLFLYEGAAYSVAASFVGVLVGLGLSWLVIEGMNRFAWFASTDSPLRMVFTVKPTTLLAAGAAGLLVAMVTVVSSSLRISDVNIVAAMKNLPEPARLRRARWVLVVPILVLALGLFMSFQAVSGDNGPLYVLGPTLAVLGVAVMLLRLLPSRPLLTVLSLGLMAFSQLAFQIDAVKESDQDGSTVFFMTSMILVLAAIALIVLNFPVVVWVMRQTLARMRRILPVVRVALAYPAERAVRTGFTLGMFSLVIFMATMASIFLALFTTQGERLRLTEVGGFDAIVVTNPLNPVSDLEGRLRDSDLVDSGSISEISAIGSARAHLAQYRASDYRSEMGPTAADPDAPLSERVTGLDPLFLRTTMSAFETRSPQYASDREAWDALSNDTSLVVVDDTYSGSSWQVTRPVVQPGDTLKLVDPASGETYDKTVIGRLASSPLWWRPLSGVLMSQSAMERDFPSAVGEAPGLYLIRLTPGLEPKAVANSIEKELIANGAQVELVSELLDLSLSWLDMIRIMQGFLAFGLVVGVAGLAVVAARAVYQRKQDIGALRALGFRRGMVLMYFLVESSFVALLGILLGVAAGTLAGFRMYLNDVRDDVGGSFVFPAMEIGALVLVVYLAAMAFTFVPAMRAASMQPAEALRPRE